LLPVEALHRAARAPSNIHIAREESSGAKSRERSYSFAIVAQPLVLVKAGLNANALATSAASPETVDDTRIARNDVYAMNRQRNHPGPRRSGAGPFDPT